MPAAVYSGFCRLLPWFLPVFPPSWQKYFLPWQKPNPARYVAVPPYPRALTVAIDDGRINWLPVCDRVGGRSLQGNVFFDNLGLPVLCRFQLGFRHVYTLQK